MHGLSMPSTVDRIFTDGQPSDEFSRLLFELVSENKLSVIQATALHRAARLVLRKRQYDDVQLAIGTAYLDDLAKLLA